MSHADLNSRIAPALASPANLAHDATRDVSAALNLLLADVFALYIKTKNLRPSRSSP